MALCSPSIAEPICENPGRYPVSRPHMYRACSALCSPGFAFDPALIRWNIVRMICRRPGGNMTVYHHSRVFQFPFAFRWIFDEGSFQIPRKWEPVISHRAAWLSVSGNLVCFFFSEGNALLQLSVSNRVRSPPIRAGFRVTLGFALQRSVSPAKARRQQTQPRYQAKRLVSG